MPEAEKVGRIKSAKDFQPPVKQTEMMEGVAGTEFASQPPITKMAIINSEIRFKRLCDVKISPA